MARLVECRGSGQVGANGGFVVQFTIRIPITFWEDLYARECEDWCACGRQPRTDYSNDPRECEINTRFMTQWSDARRTNTQAVVSLDEQTKRHLLLAIFYRMDLWSDAAADAGEDREVRASLHRIVRNARLVIARVPDGQAIYDEIWADFHRRMPKP